MLAIYFRMIADFCPLFVTTKANWVGGVCAAADEANYEKDTVNFHSEERKKCLFFKALSIR